MSCATLCWRSSFIFFHPRHLGEVLLAVNAVWTLQSHTCWSKCRYAFFTVLACDKQHCFSCSNIFWCFSLFLFCRLGTNVTSLLSESTKGSLKSAQPQLVSIGSLGHGAQYVIVAKNDSFALPLDLESLTCAVDRLFKFFWLCNLQYPCQLSSVF